MSVTKDLLDKISEYEQSGKYTPDEIVQGLSKSETWPEIATKVQKYLQSGETADRILSGIKESSVTKTRKEIMAEKTAEIRKRHEQELVESTSTLERGLTGVGAGMMGVVRGAGQLVGKVSAADVEEARRLEKPLAGTTAFKIGKFVGETAPLAPLPGGITGGLLRKAAVSGAIGAGIGALQQRGEQEDITENVAAGAAGGALSAGALWGGSKIFNSIRGPVLNEMQQLGKKYGIPLTMGEIKNSAYLQRVESWLENFGWFGISKFRRGQQEGLKQAGQSMLGQYVVTPGAATTQAMKEANDAYLSGLYSEVRRLGKTLPGVSATNTEKIGKDALDEFPNAFEFIQNTKVKDLLQKITAETESRVVKGTMKVAGKPVTTVKTVTPEFSFEDLWALRKGLGEEVGAAPNESVRRVINNIRHAVSDDMDTMFSKVPGEAGSKFKQANEEWKRLSLKFDAVREAYDAAMHTTKKGTTQFFSADAFATQMKKLANDPKYKKNIKWTPEEQEYMTGLAKIMERTQRGSHFMENPPTGLRYGPLLAGEGMLGLMGGGPAGAAGMFGGTKLFSLLSTTPAGQRLATAASRIHVDSPQMDRFIRKLYVTLPKIAAQQAASITPETFNEESLPEVTTP